MMIVQRPEEKQKVLQNLIEKLDVQNILVFGNNIQRLHDLKDYLEQLGHKVAFIYNKDGEVRDTATFLQQ